MQNTKHITKQKKKEKKKGMKERKKFCFTEKNHQMKTHPNLRVGIWITFFSFLYYTFRVFKGHFDNKYYFYEKKNIYFKNKN